MKGITFLSSKELINRASCDFYSISTKKIDENNIFVSVYHNASGSIFQFIYEKEDEKWREKEVRWGRVKKIVERPQYICYEIRRLTKEWDMDKRYIPRDSIK